MRIAAKDVGKLQLNNDALKQEIEQLRSRAKDETRRMQAETEERYSDSSLLPEFCLLHHSYNFVLSLTSHSLFVHTALHCTASLSLSDLPQLLLKRW